MKILPVNNINFSSTTKIDTNNNNESRNTVDSKVNPEVTSFKTDLAQNYKKYATIGGGALLLLTGVLMRKRIASLFSPKITKPEYLYHMTSLENYNSMLRDGIIKKSKPELGDGVFLSNYSDLRKKYDKNTLTRMVRWYAGMNYSAPPAPSKTVVLLKIPISAIDSNVLRWRQISLRNMAPVSQEWVEFSKFADKNVEDLHNLPLEYLYEKEIPMNLVEKFAQVKVDDLPSGNIKDFTKAFWAKVDSQR